MNDDELQQLLQQQNFPQLQQGLLGGIGQEEQLALGDDQALQGLLSKGQQANQEMAQTAQNVQQQAMQNAQAGQQRLQEQQMAGQQALAQQEQKRKAMMGMVMSFLPMGKWLGAAGSAVGKAIGIGGK